MVCSAIFEVALEKTNLGTQLLPEGTGWCSIDMGQVIPERDLLFDELELARSSMLLVSGSWVSDHKVALSCPRELGIFVVASQLAEVSQGTSKTGSIASAKFQCLAQASSNSLGPACSQIS